MQLCEDYNIYRTGVQVPGMFCYPSISLVPRPFVDLGMVIHIGIVIASHIRWIGFTVSLVWVEVRVLAKYHHLHLKRENILQHTAQYTALSTVLTSHTSSIVQAVVQVKTSFAAVVNEICYYTLCLGSRPYIYVDQHFVLLVTATCNFNSLPYW